MEQIIDGGHVENLQGDAQVWIRRLVDTNGCLREGEESSVENSHIGLFFSCDSPGDLELGIYSRDLCTKVTSPQRDVSATYSRLKGVLLRKFKYYSGSSRTTQEVHVKS